MPPREEPIEELTRPLEGEITILLQEGLDKDIRIYAKMFTDLHPGVRIKFDTYGWIEDSSQLLALTTRLLADPPDIFHYDATDMSVEKMASDALYVDLYELFRGTRGIDMDDYFSGVFSAIEERGSLYRVPIYVYLESNYLNKRLFDSIGVDAEQIGALTLDDKIDFYYRAAEANPGEQVYLEPRFSIMQVFSSERLYDLDTKTVSVDTPAVRERLERAMGIPVNSDYVIFGPDVYRHIFGPHTTDYGLKKALQPNKHLFWQELSPELYQYVTIFLQCHPDNQVSMPVLQRAEDGSGYIFSAGCCFSIMKESDNIDLSWEFLRFILEYDENLMWHKKYADYRGGLSAVPINRARFEEQVFAALDTEVFPCAYSYVQIDAYITGTFEEYKEQLVVTTMDFLRNGMEHLSVEERYNRAVMNSLVYPDVWLLHTGQQSIEQTLRNIQNRLELYIYE